MAQPDSQDGPADDPGQGEWQRPAWAEALEAGRIWEALGVPEAAGRDELEGAYRCRALECHPDRHANSAQAQALFVALTEAKDTILPQTVAPQVSGLLLLNRFLSQVVSHRIHYQSPMPPTRPPEGDVINRWGAPNPHERAHPMAHSESELRTQRELLRQAGRAEEDLLAALSTPQRRPTGLRAALRAELALGAPGTPAAVASYPAGTDPPASGIRGSWPTR